MILKYYHIPKICYYNILFNIYVYTYNVRRSLCKKLPISVKK